MHPSRRFPLVRTGLVLLAAALVPVLVAPPAAAHPLGDFTVSSHLGVRVEPTSVAVDVVLDIAEVPTLQAFPDLQRGDGPLAGRVPEGEQRAYRDRLCPALRDAVELTVGGRQARLDLLASGLMFPPGEGGLATARLECALRTTSSLATVGAEVVVTDRLQVQPVGWREVVAVGDGVTLTASDVPTTSPSDVLRRYPPELLQRPVDLRGARLSVAAGSRAVSGAPGIGDGVDPVPAQTSAAGAVGGGWGLAGVTTALTDSVAAERLRPTVALVAVLLAVLLGAAHAFAPGHGKTLMAAYLLGRDATIRQALLIGASVTLTHTIGVLLLGVVVTAAALTAPERIYPWLGLGSGLLIAWIGTGLLRTGGHGHAHEHHRSHAHGHAHPHEQGHPHEHGARPARGLAAPATATLLRAPAGLPEESPSLHPPVPQPRTSRRSLVTVGLAGGMVPTPSALVVVLGGIALGRAWFGVLLVLAYGVGMAAALVGTGLLLVRLRDRARAWSRARPDARALTSALVRLPTVTAALVVVIGLGLATRSLTQLR